MDVGLGDNQHAASVYATIRLGQLIAGHSSSLRLVILNHDDLTVEVGRGGSERCIMYHIYNCRIIQMSRFSNSHFFIF